METNDKNWKIIQGMYFLQEKGVAYPQLENKVYRFDVHPDFGPHLKFVSDNFSFPYKVYGMQTNFINRVKKTYNNTKQNLGILFNGIKGTGKTVCAQSIANELNLPVIIINFFYENLAVYLSQLTQDVVVFVDEFEKIYTRDDERDEKILTVMDGVLNSPYRKVFLLTTNQLRVNDNLMQRPGRIRYVKEFNDMEHEMIVEIVDDLLTQTHHREALIDFISSLQTITVDIVKAVINEVNIHDENPIEFASVFNVELNDSVYDVSIKGVDGKENEVLFVNAQLHPNGNFEAFEDDPLHADDKRFAIIDTVLSETEMIVYLMPNKIEDGKRIFESQRYTHDNSKLEKVTLIVKESGINRHKSFKKHFIF